MKKTFALIGLLVAVLATTVLFAGSAEAYTDPAVQQLQNQVAALQATITQQSAQITALQTQLANALTVLNAIAAALGIPVPTP